MQASAITIHKAPPNSGEVALGRTLTSLLDEAVAERPNPRAFNQRVGDGWQPTSTGDFRDRAENLALGLLGIGLERGDRVAFFTHSDISFCLADMACLTAGLIDVPIYLTHTESAIRFILDETEARALVVSDGAQLAKIAPLLAAAPALETVVVWAPLEREVALPDGIELTSFSALEAAGAEAKAARPDRIADLKAQIDAQDLATIIYTSGTTGMPKGVMLSHENISSNGISAGTGDTALRWGPDEVVLLFLPLTHIFARFLLYAHIWYGATLYFSDPDRLREDLREVRPTFFAAVPRVIEKAFERILTTGASLTGIKRRLFDWSLDLARRFDIERRPEGIYALQLAVVDRLVFSKWREGLGGRIRQIIVGGAAIRPELVNAFGAAKIEILQGYGLTETSPVIAFNRVERNRPGTVGPVLAGAEVMLDAEGEILTRGPHVMLGYYKQPDQTAETIDAEGWFRTGDLGAFDDDGYLRITGRKKNLFKLSTGKYVMPQPIEDRLEGEPLIEVALVVGEGEKYCGALIFASGDGLAAQFGEDDPALLRKPEVQTRYCELLRGANRDLPPWSQVKRIALVRAELTPQNGLLTPKLSVRREKVLERFADDLAALFGRGEGSGVVVEV